MLYISCRLLPSIWRSRIEELAGASTGWGGGRGRRGPSLNDPQRKLKRGGGIEIKSWKIGGIKKENVMIFLYFGSVYGRACVNIYIFSIFTRLGKTHIKKGFFLVVEPLRSGSPQDLVAQNHLFYL